MPSAIARIAWATAQLEPTALDALAYMAEALGKSQVEPEYLTVYRGAWCVEKVEIGGGMAERGMQELRLRIMLKQVSSDLLAYDAMAAVQGSPTHEHVS